jgi:hypothetical protein
MTETRRQTSRRRASRKRKALVDQPAEAVLRNQRSIVFSEEAFKPFSRC